MARMSRRLGAFVAVAIVAGTVAVAGASGQGVAWDGPLTITSGGTYTGNWMSTDSTPAIEVATSEPVVIRHSRMVSTGAGPVVKSRHGVASSVTLYGVHAVGGSGRFYEAEAGFRSVTIRRCTIQNTRGIELSQGAAGSSVVITRNRHRNIQGNGVTPVGNFVQLRSVRNSSVDVSWNEVVNEHNRSNPEDLISLYESANARIHDNFFFGQSKPDNVYNSSSQNGITIESGVIPGSASNNVVANNQFVAGEAIGMFSGNNNLFLGNRVVRSGYLTDGVTRNRNGYEGIWIAPGFSGNHAHGNVIGYVNRDGKRSDGRLPGAVEGNSAEWAQNRRIRGRISLALERNEWAIWRGKLKARKIVVGSPPLQ
jgi:hypothetical protein